MEDKYGLQIGFRWANNLKMWHLLNLVGMLILAHFCTAAVFCHFIICERGETAAVVVVVAVAAVVVVAAVAILLKLIWLKIYKFHFFSINWLV